MRGRQNSGAVAERLDEQDDISQDLSYTDVVRRAGAKRVNGRLVREVLVPSGTTRVVDGKRKAIYFRQDRPVALTLKEAQATNSDYYDAERATWIRGGLKAEVEAPENLGNGPASHEIVLVDLPDGEDLSEEAAQELED